MTAHTHLLRRSGACYQQVQQQRGVAMPVVGSREDTSEQHVFEATAGAGRPVIFSVWNKKTGSGNQN